MTTNDEPLSTYRASYVAGLERTVSEQQAAMAKALEALEAVEWVNDWDGEEVCAWCKEMRYFGGGGHATDCGREAALAGLRRVLDG